MPTKLTQPQARYLLEVDGTEAEVGQLVRHATSAGITLKKLPPGEIAINYSGLDDYMQMADYFSQTVAGEGHFYALIYIRIMGLQSLSNTLGFKTVNDLLQQVIARLKKHAPADSRLACLNLAEFMVLAPVVGPYQGAAQLCVELLEKLQRPYESNGQLNYLSCAMGISLYPQDGKRFDKLQLYAATAAQRAPTTSERYCFYRSDMSVQDKRRLALINALRHAYANSEFNVYYQPKYDLQTRKLASVEALLRWQYPQGVDVSPDEFIPLLESTGQIIAVGRWVLERACRDYGRWRKMGLKPVPIAVNVAATQFAQTDLARNVRHILQNHDIPQGAIELEITESSFIANLEHVMVTLNFFKQQAIPLTIDDFGTGYSSLGYLQKFPVNSLKIDKSFIKDLPENKNNIAIVEAIFAISRSFGLDVVAEGVEIEAQASFLQAHGCKLGQGYLFGKAMSAGELEQLLIEAV